VFLAADKGVTVVPQARGWAWVRYQIMSFIEPSVTVREHGVDGANLYRVEPVLVNDQGSLPSDFCPTSPRSLEELGLPFSFVTDLILKIMYFNGNILGRDIASRACLPWAITSDALNFLAAEGYCGTTGIRGTAGPGSDFAESFQYLVTGLGRERAREILQLSQYAGPAPVHLEDYLESARALRDEVRVVPRDQLLRALSHLVLPDQLVDVLGTALTARQPLFLFGPPGNGKSSIAEACATVLGGPIFIPQALYAHGEVIRLFDPVHHRLVSQSPMTHDKRWALVHRPVIHVGGELKGNELELSFDRGLGYYEAPLQLKANGGIFHLDDFGRQVMPPRQILNRLIVPLESGFDYLNVARAGTTVTVPYATILLLSTNLDPGELVDEAFLRRVRYKAAVPDPSPEQFRTIFQRVCVTHGLGYSPQAVDYLLQHHYAPSGRGLRGCHPRDLVEQLIAMARYLGISPELSPRLIDRVCHAYFAGIGTSTAPQFGGDARTLA
jgi:hypothetical protein